MNGTLCMLISNPTFRHVRASIESAVKYVVPHVDEVLLASSTQCRAEKWPQKFEHLFGDRVKVRHYEGADSRDDVARVRFGLFDAAQGDWIYSLDDDDGVLGPPMSPGTLSSKVFLEQLGFYHSSILAVCGEDSGPRRRGDIYERPSKAIETRLDANHFRGSFYAYRREAWQEVAPYLDRDLTDYEEWRVVWHMLRLGWKGHYDNRVIQYQRVRDAGALVEQQGKTGRSWATVCCELEERFGDTDQDRYWQNWDQAKHRVEVEKFWKEDKAQVARRMHFDQLMAKVAMSFHDRTPVLDFGCGTGEDFPMLSDLGFDYNGCDVTPGMLEMFREKHGADVKLHTDDLLCSRWADQQWPVVVNSAVLPHLPRNKHERAISELWRVTGRCLVVRLFGVDAFGEDRTSSNEGFLYQRLRAQTWRKMFENCEPTRMEVHRGETPETKDIMVVVLWR